MWTKRNAVLVIVGAMVVFFAVGAIWNALRPSSVERTVRDLPTYPGAREVSPSDAVTERYSQSNPPGEVRLFTYELPSASSSAAVLRYYRTHKPSTWRHVTDRCYARGDVRVLLFERSTRELDVVVADNIRCP
jgi:hypothetical protein